MTKFIAIKTHYDHRKSLPSYLKFSKLPTEEEYKEYTDLYSQGVGGKGFHECLNFSIPKDGNVKIYLPPTCLPSKEYVNEEFVIFSFTYKQDPELPSVVLGVHGGAKFESLEGILRTDYQTEGKDIDDLIYYASADRDLTTLFTSPLDYDYKEGRYTPIYSSWGFGLRYIESENAEKIIRDAYNLAINKLNSANNVERQVVEREILVLKKIFDRYFKGELESKKSFNLPASIIKGGDKDIGYKGELEVYNRELEYVRSLNLPDSYVEWLSQGVPNSVYDIKSVREKNGIIVDHFIEVKSSKVGFGENIYISSRQVEFLKNNSDISSIVLVNFNGNDVSVIYKSFEDIENEFKFEPIKYKLIMK